MPQFTKALPLSPARVRLKEAIAARVEVEQRLAAMTAAVAKLDGEIAAVGPAQATLARLQSASAAALLDWADAVDGSSAPAIDEVAFTDATKVLDSARASAAAASQAKASLESRYMATANAFPAIAAAASAAIAEVIEESALPLIAEAVEAHRVLARKQEKVVQAVDQLRAISTSLRAGTPEQVAAVAAQGRVATAMRPIFDKPSDMAATMASRAAWNALVDDLRVDATAKLAS